MGQSKRSRSHRFYPENPAQRIQIKLRNQVVDQTILHENYLKKKR